MHSSPVYLRNFVRILLLSVGLGVVLPAFAQDGDSSSKPQDTRAPNQNTRRSQKITLEANQSLFDFMAIVNACGYNRDLEGSNPLRNQIKQDFAAQVHASEEAQTNLNRACGFYKDHELADPGRNLAQYVSLSLELKPAPLFLPAVLEADMPPDASRVLGFLPLVDRLYDSANMGALWHKYKPAYDALIDAQHDPVSQAIQGTDLYLRLSTGGYVEQGFTVSLEPQIAPKAVNARNYGPDYFVVLSPDDKGQIDMHALRHTYLHYLIDPILLNYSVTLHHDEPLLKNVTASPMDDSYKSDIILLATESLIRAIEARTTSVDVSGVDRKTAAKTTEEARQKIVDASVAQGYVLTEYFYESLTKFEKDPAGFKSAIGDILRAIDLDHEVKFAASVQFAQQADPELVTRHQKELTALDLAEQRLWSGDIAGARQLAQKALDTKHGDQAEALFILARADVGNRDMQQAIVDFQRTLEIATEPSMIAWSHIYLGRIMDIKGERDQALGHYNAALKTGDSNAAIKNAAQQGIAKAFEPPHKPGAEDSK